MSDRAEQVSEQIARARSRVDHEMDLVQMDAQAEQVEIQRAEREIEDGAGRIARINERSDEIDGGSTRRCERPAGGQHAVRDRESEVRNLTDDGWAGRDAGCR